MSIVHYKTSLNDFVPVSFGHIIDRFLNDSVTRKGGSQYSFVPRVDVLEDEKAFEIHVAVPGMNKEDFKIDLNASQLTVSGERKFPKDKDSNFKSIETQYGAFKRSFSLPDNIDAEKISAAYKNGLLQIVLPKVEKNKTTINID